MSRLKFHRRQTDPPIVGDAEFTVTWNAPETDADASAVATITDYRVYYSQTITDRENSAGSVLVGSAATTKLVTGVVAGVWYAWVATITAAGESDVSPPMEYTAT